MSHHIVEAIDVHYAYPDGTVALQGVSFRVLHGESVALVGENGAGKSTLLLHLNGCLTATRGAIRIGDYLLDKNTVQAARRSVGFVFQNPDDQLFMPTVFDDVAFGPLNLGLAQDEVERTVFESLQTVGAWHLRKRPPYKLSQGEKRLVSIAAVLAMSPDILVMDEPSSGLDPQSRRRLIELLKTFLHSKIIATHDLDLAMDLCQRVIVIHQGKVAADGPAEKIFQDETLLKNSGLEKPLRMQNCPMCKPEK